MSAPGGSQATRRVPLGPSAPSILLSSNAAEAGRQRVAPFVLVILVVGIAVYINSFRGVLIYDDIRCIVDNKGIRQLFPIWQHFASRSRPVVELSLAINYAIGELNVRGYHAFNLTVHLLAGITLFGVVRRTLLLDALRASFGQSAGCIACTVALIWVVHPLQTESVTYIIQRAESLASLFYLLTLYGALRAAGSQQNRWWYSLAIVASCLGLGCKAITVTAPLLVLIYDWTMLAGTLRAALCRRWALYLALAATWAVPAASGVLGNVFNTEGRDVGYGFGYKGITPGEYALTQAGVIVHYLKLSFWPVGLCLDYKWPVVKSLSDAVIPGLFLFALLGTTAWALWRKPRLGFLAVSFFVVLAPTSSFVPLKDRAVEHRMYLALASVIVLVVLAGRGLLQYSLNKTRWSPGTRGGLATGLVFAVVLLLSVRTVRRNQDYHSAVAAWKSVATQRPHNYRAANNVGYALVMEGRRKEAIEWFRRSLEVNPRYYWAHYNLGVNLAHEGEIDQAIRHYREALRIKPNLTKARGNLAILLEKNANY